MVRLVESPLEDIILVPLYRLIASYPDTPKEIGIYTNLYLFREHFIEVIENEKNKKIVRIPVIS